MEFDINNLDIIDLISEKHAFLRKVAEDRWSSQSDIYFSHSEWHLLSKVDQKSITISQAALILGVSRQAMQKGVSKLEKRGYLISDYQEGNKRDKFLTLTDAGRECCQINNRLKAELEIELGELLGRDRVKDLRELFIKEWSVK